MNDRTPTLLPAEGGYQGDIKIVRIDTLPAGLVEVPPTKQGYVVAHSETGHHHVVSAEGATYWRPAEEGLTTFLSVTAEHVDLVHLRPYNTHDPIRLPAGNYAVKRQREARPQGVRAVMD